MLFPFQSLRVETGTMRCVGQQIKVTKWAREAMHAAASYFVQVLKPYDPLITELLVFCFSL
jgi:hypothetical protein